MAVKLTRDEMGAAAVEFALILPLLTALVFGIFEFGMAWHTYQVITDAAREGARRAAVANPVYTQAVVFQSIEDNISRTRPLSVQIRNASYCAADLPTTVPKKNEVEIYGCNWDGASGTAARVAVRYGYEFTVIGPLVGMTTGQRAIALQTNFSMRNE